MTKQYTLTRVNRKPFTSRAGKDFTRVYVKTEELGDDVLLTGLENAGNKEWVEGMVVAMEVEKVEREDPETGETRAYWNFKNPRPHQQSDLEGRVVRLEMLLKDHLARHAKDE
jgi:hypothetical protein